MKFCLQIPHKKKTTTIQLRTKRRDSTLCFLTFCFLHFPKILFSFYVTKISKLTTCSSYFPFVRVSYQGYPDNCFWVQVCFIWKKCLFPRFFTYLRFNNHLLVTEPKFPFRFIPMYELITILAGWVRLHAKLITCLSILPNYHDHESPAALRSDTRYVTKDWFLSPRLLIVLLSVRWTDIRRIESSLCASNDLKRGAYLVVQNFSILVEIYFKFILKIRTISNIQGNSGQKT